MPRRNDYIEGYTSDKKWLKDSAMRTEDSLRNAATITDGVIRWNSNNNVPPDDIIEFAVFLGLPVDPAKCKVANDEDTKVFLAAYRQRMAQRTPEQIAEQRAEARAAMGPGVEMVDIISGERYTT